MVTTQLPDLQSFLVNPVKGIQAVLGSGMGGVRDIVQGEVSLRLLPVLPSQHAPQEQNPQITSGGVTSPQT